MVAKATGLQGEKSYHTANPEGRMGRVLFDVTAHDNEHMLNMARESRDMRRRHNNQVISARMKAFAGAKLWLTRTAGGHRAPIVRRDRFAGVFPNYYPRSRLSDRWRSIRPDSRVADRGPPADGILILWLLM